jgi:hypothetical protein
MDGTGTLGILGGATDTREAMEGHCDDDWYPYGGTGTDSRAEIFPKIRSQ